MSNKTLGILAVIAAVFLTLAIVVSTGPETSPTDMTKARYLIGNIEPGVISKIHIGRGEDAVTLNNTAKGFTVENKDGYPAKTAEINNLINTCIDIKISELYTDDPKNHTDLGVTEEKTRNLVKFFKEDGSLLTGVIIGDTKQTGEGTYIRMPGSDEVYVTLDNPYFRTGAINYVNEQITETLSREQVETVMVDTPQSTYVLSENENGDIVPDQTLDGNLKSTEAANVFTALSSLRFNDVSKGAQGLTFTSKYICNTTDDIKYTLRLAQKNDKTFVKCSAVYEGTLPSKSMQVESPEALKEKEAKYLANETAQKFKQRHKGWTYEISSQSAKNLTKPLTELFEKPQPTETADPNAPAGPAEKPDSGKVDK